MNYPTIILQKASTCLTGAVSDGRESKHILWKKIVQLHDLSKQK